MTMGPMVMSMTLPREGNRHDDHGSITLPIPMGPTVMSMTLPREGNRHDHGSHGHVYEYRED